MHERTFEYCFYVYIIKHKKHGLCPYDDQRYLLADWHDGSPNPHIQAYSNRDIKAEKHLVVDQLEPGSELIIQYCEMHFTRKHARVTKRLKACVMGIERVLQNNNANCDLYVTTS